MASRVRVATGVAALLSGAAALVYQTLWARALGLVMGTTVAAVATVLATFMAGLGLGSALAGRAGSLPFRSLRRAYAALEAGIAASALAFPLVVGLPEPWLASLYDAGALAPLALARAATAGLAILLPALLMGATLPVLTAVAGATAGEAGRVAGRLYAANAAGAVLGSLAVPLVLLHVLGALAHEVAWTRALVLLLGPTTYAFALVLAAVIAGIAAGSALLAGRADASARPALGLAAIQAGLAAASLGVTQAMGALPLAVGSLVRSQAHEPNRTIGDSLWPRHGARALPPGGKGSRGGTGASWKAAGVCGAPPGRVMGRGGLGRADGSPHWAEGGLAEWSTPTRPARPSHRRARRHGRAPGPVGVAWPPRAC